MKSPDLNPIKNEEIKVHEINPQNLRELKTSVYTTFLAVCYIHLAFIIKENKILGILNAEKFGFYNQVDYNHRVL